MVVYTERCGDVIRIISARKAIRREVQRYAQRLKTDWIRLNGMSDKEIDTSDIAELDDEFFEKAEVRLPLKKSVTMRLDADVLEWFKSQGKAIRLVSISFCVNTWRLRSACGPEISLVPTFLRGNPYRVCCRQF